MIQHIPLIIPYFMQPTYLKNAINWFHWYYPKNHIFILVNGFNSHGSEHVDMSDERIHYIPFNGNDCANNLSLSLSNFPFEYYIISDPDIMPHPATPPCFLEVMKQAIDEHGFHRAGFNLITSDIPDWLHKRDEIKYNEECLRLKEEEIDYKSIVYKGFRAPLDTTFCLYKKSNGGWYAPMSGEDWSNCLRIFDAFHLQWYIHPDHVNDEMHKYYTNCQYRDLSPVSAGKNNNRPLKYMP